MGDTMEYASKTVTLKNGKACLIRRAEEADAEALLELMRTVVGESTNLVLEPGEITTTVEREREILRANCEADRSLVLLALVDGKLVGTCNFGPAGKRNRTLHRSAAAISIYRAFWGLGIGTALLGEILDAARAAGYEQMELEVVSTNAPAVGLYKKLGFEVTGTMPHTMKYQDGTYADFLFMVKYL